MQVSANNSLLHSTELEKALDVFANSTEKIFTSQLQQIVENISRTGLTSYSWPQIKILLFFRIKQIFLLEYKDEPDKSQWENSMLNISRALDLFSSPPFTLQRICELTLKPYYKTSRKFLFAIEKVLSVISVQSYLSPSDYNLIVQQDLNNDQIISNDSMDTTQNGRADEKHEPMEVEPSDNQL